MKKNELVVLMVLFIAIIIIGILFISGLLYGIGNYINSPTNNANDTISVASWNLRNFVLTKATNETLLNYYADKLSDHDVFVIQEIYDPTGEAVRSLAIKFPTYRYVISASAGQGSSKEPYAVFYNTKVELLTVTDWTEKEQSNFERPPLEISFRGKNWTFTLFTIHIKVTDVALELTELERLIGNPNTDTILLGDLNADGESYYDGVIHHFLGWHWLITSEMDTTVAKSSHAYDRILINDAAENNFINVGIMNDVTINQSDHYLVSATFNPNEP